MMFASKTPASRNRDPKPWQGNLGDRYAFPQECGRDGAEVIHKPRPQFAAAQTHAPNPILLTLRETPADLRLWGREHLIDALTFDIAVPERYRAPVRDATPAQREHALRVLNRLADLDALAEMEPRTC